MNDSPRVAFAAEDDRSAPEPFRVQKLERHKDDTRRQRLNAEVYRRQSLKGRAASGVCPHVGKHRAERRVDRGAARHAFRHIRRRMKDRRGVGERGVKRLPLEVFERREEPTQHTGDRGRVAPGSVA